MKWQDLLIFFKKKSRSRRLWIGGSSLTIFGVLAYVFLLSGVTITTSGDVVCGETCEIYTNITSTYWEICFADVNFKPLYFDKEPSYYEVLVPARGAGNWRPLKVGDCIKRKNKYNYLPNRFKIVVEKKAWETIKYGVEFGGKDLDPYLYSENTKLVNGKTYEALCDEVIERKWIQEDVPCPKENISCKGTIPIYILKNITTDCVLNGKVEIDGKELKDKCSLNNKGAICDQPKNERNQLGDSNGDGICDKGETCKQY